MKYYYFKKPNSAAHIWLVDDTACRMYSTGGIRKTGRVYDHPSGRRICQLCSKVDSKKVELKDLVIYL
jgi:hypothetical protein